MIRWFSRDRHQVILKTERGDVVGFIELSEGHARKVRIYAEMDGKREELVIEPCRWMTLK